MRIYCFGAAKLVEKFLGDENIKLNGIFDNNKRKWDTDFAGVKIEKPYYADDIDVYITAREKFHFEIINQLLCLGYRKFHLVKNIVENGFELIDFNYSHKNYERDKKKLILLYLEHKSYSGIYAINKLFQQGIVNTHGFIVKMFNDNVTDKDYYYDIAVAEYILTERCWKHYEEVKIPAKLIQLWHGFPLKAMEKMSPTYVAEGDYDLYREWSRYNYILSYGQNYTSMISACFGTRFNQFKVTGMPRNDLLFCVDGRTNLEKLFPESREKKIVLYMPTFREIAGSKDGSDNGYIFYWDDFNLESFKDFCRKHNIYFIFKLHPSDESKVRNWCEQSDCIGILNDESLGEHCTYEFLNGIDVLITDYSSVYFDYMLLDRPIIFTNQDEEEYLANRGMIFEPLDFWRPGSIVNTMDDLQYEIEKILIGEDSHKEHRKQLMPFVHKYTDGNSTQRLFDLLKEDSEKIDV